MAGYTKNIAVLRQIRSGFSADGGKLSGLVKAEKYGPFFRAEISLINFAPLTSGRYVAAISDGINTVCFDGPVFEGESEVDTSGGFAALVCFVGTEVLPVASAVCGDFAWAAAACARRIESAEKIKNSPDPGAAYEDEAIAEENYYEYSAYFKGESALCAAQEQKDGRGVCKDEDAGGLCQESEEGAPDETAAVGGARKSAGGAEDNGAEDGGDVLKNKKNTPHHARTGAQNKEKAEDIAEEIPLAGDLKFFERMRGEIEKLLSAHPREEALERAVEHSRWAKVSYGGQRFYVFGIIYEDGSPSYICYGVPAMGMPCPESLTGMAGFIPASEEGNNGYWVMYQDARTGASIKLNSV